MKFAECSGIYSRFRLSLPRHYWEWKPCRRPHNTVSPTDPSSKREPQMICMCWKMGATGSVVAVGM